MSSERAIHVDSREDLIYLLAEAAEIEHNLMCCYLFAAFSLKDEADGSMRRRRPNCGAGGAPSSTSRSRRCRI